MKCPRCQQENPADAVFCQECGSRLEQACPGCDTANRLDAKFCKKCGQPVAVRPPAATTAKFPPPASYTPKHLAEKILTSKSALEGERKQVTVLFADLKGSMELLADRDPEEARKILDPVLERMMEAVHRYEGTVNQVMGDGIMALFGAPLAHEDHAVRACYAALRMQEAVKRYADEVRRTARRADRRSASGLNSGEVVVRAIGSDLHMDYTAVGQTTHLAARMEQLADAGHDPAHAPTTLALAEGFVAVTALGPVNVKGLSEPVEVFELDGVGAFAHPLRRSRGPRALARSSAATARWPRSTPRSSARAAGSGQVVAVVAEAGIGKSRLCAEFVERCRARGHHDPRGTRRRARQGDPDAPHAGDVARLLRDRRMTTIPRRPARRSPSRLLPMDDSFREVLPFVFDLFGVPDPAQSVAHDRPRAARRGASTGS